MLQWWLFLTLILLAWVLAEFPLAFTRRSGLPIVVRVGSCADFLEQPLRMIEEIGPDRVWLVLGLLDAETEQVVHAWARNRPEVKIISVQDPSFDEAELPAVRLECRAERTDRTSLIRGLANLGRLSTTMGFRAGRCTGKADDRQE